MMLRRNIPECAFLLFFLVCNLMVTGEKISFAQGVDADQRLTERTLGNENAPVTMIEYASLTCSHCASFNENTLPDIKRNYIDTGRLRLIFRDFPFDRAALTGAMVARCLPAERYFPFIDVLFRTQGQWAASKDPIDGLRQAARLAGMPAESFDACAGDKALADHILAKRLDGEKKFKVDSTPTFVFNDGKEKITGAQPYDQFKFVIERLAAPP